MQLSLQVKGRDKHINNLKKKCQKESEQNRERQQRIETLERYLADIPTLEDHQKQSQKVKLPLSCSGGSSHACSGDFSTVTFPPLLLQLKDSELKTAALQETVLALETELGDVQAAFREQELQLETQKHKEMELLSTVRRWGPGTSFTWALQELLQPWQGLGWAADRAI